ncbi:hypothetical protein K1T71_004255 [Dendrolimus kikuchii]|uniref:Uncharacterized protein n=1 Tax=Dendrolimus kikuchii TaxID=765133 RepID=A0ACC1D7E3_9NEOP|nr:hypothetical protein K1T71_004255 [Dendrolimus kikuchii]
MCRDNLFQKLVLLLIFAGRVLKGETEQTTSKETRPEYIHPDGLLNFDPYLSDFKPEVEDDDYIPLPENDETIDGLPIFLLEPKNSYVLRTKPANLICRAANALQVFFKCNDVRTDKTVQYEHVDPQNGVRVVEVELNVTRNELDEYFGGKYSCECYAWNSKGKIRSQAVFIEYAYIKKQFPVQPQSSTVEAGNTVTLRCVPPAAAPPPTLKWTRNGAIIEPSDETLVLPKVGLQDIANYTCIAENIAGRRESDVAVLSVYGFYSNNVTLYVGVGITIAMLAAGVAIMYVWCKYKSARPGYSAARAGIPKSHINRGKDNAGPDLTRTCNEYWMQGPDNHYDMPHVRDSYSSPFGNRSRHQSSQGSNHYEMKPYSPSGESASSCYTNSRTMTSRSSECSSSQLAELMTSSPTSTSKVDVAVTLPTGHIDTSYRDKICLTIVK